MLRRKGRMHRAAATVAAALTVAALLPVAGCTNPAEAEKSENPAVWGYVASARSAQLEVPTAQLGARDLVVKRVLAPTDAWIVVHADDNGKPGMRVGLTRVRKGETRNVKVALEKVGTEKVIVALHADRGERGKFDFDMMAPTMSPDRPYFVDEEELAVVVTVRQFGVPTPAGTAALEVGAQPGARDGIVVKRALAPADAWIVVHLDDDGAPGQRVGLARIPAGDNANVSVGLDPVPLSDTLLVALHADRGETGVFEFDMMDRVNSPDQPFFVDGDEVARAVKVK